MPYSPHVFDGVYVLPLIFVYPIFTRLFVFYVIVNCCPITFSGINLNNGIIGVPGLEIFLNLISARAC